MNGESKIFGLFEPSTENIRQSKAGEPHEFGKLIKIQEAEKQIVIDFAWPAPTWSIRRQRRVNKTTLDLAVS